MCVFAEFILFKVHGMNMYLQANANAAAVVAARDSGDTVGSKMFDSNMSFWNVINLHI